MDGHLSSHTPVHVILEIISKMMDTPVNRALENGKRQKISQKISIYSQVSQNIQILWNFHFLNVVLAIVDQDLLVGLLNQVRNVLGKPSQPRPCPYSFNPGVNHAFRLFSPLTSSTIPHLSQGAVEKRWLLIKFSRPLLPPRFTCDLTPFLDKVFLNKSCHVNSPVQVKTWWPPMLSPPWTSFLMNFEKVIFWSEY